MGEGQTKEIPPPPSSKQEPLIEDILQDVKPKHKSGELLIYIVFVALYTFAVLFGRPTEETFYLRQNIIQQFVTSQWTSIVETQQFFNYIETDFLPRISPDPVSFSSMTNEEKRTILGYNLVVGAIQLRQLRIDSTPCDAIPPGLEETLSRCFRSYSSSTQSTNSFGPSGDEDRYQYEERGGILRPATSGEIGTYPASGYIQMLSLNRTHALETVANLRRDSWISEKTRAIFLEFALYNPNVNQFLTVRMMGEIPQSGGIITSYSINSIRVFRYLSTISIGVAVVELLFVAMLVYFMTSEIINFARLRKQYLKSAWNFFDWTNILLLWITVIMRLVVLVTSFGITIDLESEEVLDLERITSLMDFEGQIGSINIFFIYFRLFEYIADVPRMDQLFRTLARAAIDLALFSIVFAIVFLAFSLSFYTAFSLYLAEFRTITQTLFTLFRVLLGDFNFIAIYEANRILGPLLFFLYVTVMFFMLFNMFLAIIADAYAYVKDKDGERNFSVKQALKFLVYKFIPNKKIVPVPEPEVEEETITGDFGPRNKPKDIRMNGSLLLGSRRLTVGVATAQAWDDKLSELDRRLFEMNAKMKFLAASELAERDMQKKSLAPQTAAATPEFGSLQKNFDLLRRLQELEDRVKENNPKEAVQALSARMERLESKLDIMLNQLTGSRTPRAQSKATVIQRNSHMLE